MSHSLLLHQDNRVVFGQSTHRKSTASTRGHGEYVIKSAMSMSILLQTLVRRRMKHCREYVRHTFNASYHGKYSLYLRQTSVHEACRSTSNISASHLFIASKGDVISREIMLCRYSPLLEPAVDATPWKAWEYIVRIVTDMLPISRK